MKNLIKFSVIFSLFFVSKTQAQSVVKSDTLAGTPLTMTMDAKVNALLETAESNCNRTTSSTTNSNNWSDDSGAVVTKPKVVVADKPKSTADICRQNPKIMGYKIQLAVVKSNEEAREVGMYFRRRFPNMKVEIDASLRPNYKVMAGSYISKQSAAGDLARIKQYFKGALAVQYRVFCVEAK